VLIVRRLKKFAAKPPVQKNLTIRFAMRQVLSRLPYAPMRMRLQVSPAETLGLWWSYVAQPFNPDRSFFDYWGKDVAELRFLWNFLHPGMVFLDVGAHHGLYTVVAAKKLDKQGRVVAFEPSPREYWRLRLHLHLNRLKAVRAEAYAVSSQNGTKTFYAVREDTTMNSLRRPEIHGALEEIVVETISLDQHCRHHEIDRVDLVKIDTEGAEIEVLEGARGILSSCRPFIICEVLDQVTRAWGYDAREIVSWLAHCGYAWFDFHPHGTVTPHTQKRDYPEVKNYLAVPAEKLALLQPWIQYSGSP